MMVQQSMLPGVLAFAATLTLTYGQVSISLYMYHRFIFHAHWSARTRGFDRWLWDMVRANYVMHYHEHHQVSRNPEEADKLAKLEKVSLSADSIKQKYPDDWLLQNFVGYSDRGITVQGPVGILGAFMFFSILPSGTVTILCYRNGDALSALLHLAGAALGMFQTMVNHDKYHADDEALEKWLKDVPYLAWLWQSAEMKRIVHEHKLHHDGKNHNRYFSMIPFDCFFLYPIWPEEHMYPVICETIKAVLGSLRAAMENLCGKVCLLLVLAGHLVIIYSSRRSMLVILLLHMLFIHSVYKSWKMSMGNLNSKFPRSHPACKSHKPRPNTVKAKEDEQSLDMDHIHVTFFFFLLAHYLVVPNAMLLWMSGSCKLLLRQRLQKLGCLKSRPCNYPALIAKMCLDGMEAIHFKRMISQEVAEFLWQDIAFVRMDASIGRIQSFRILIDLKTRCMVEATIEGSPVSAKKALTLLWFDTVFGTHVKIHAMANWGIAESVESYQLWWMQICSTMYNYFGFTVFPRMITQFWYDAGLTAECYNNIKEASKHSASAGVPFHGSIHMLQQHSPLLSFLYKVRKYFLAEFPKYKDDFPGADAEAMFVGTILHSLDHCMMDENLEDALWLDVGDSDFGSMAELMRHVRVGFVSDLPFLSFEHRYRDMQHPFFQNVYAYARSINPWFADRMDACIVK